MTERTTHGTTTVTASGIFNEQFKRAVFTERRLNYCHIA
jgi:hypothetical protein